MNLKEMSAAEFIEAVKKHGWDWSYRDFCNAIGKPEVGRGEYRDVWCEEVWEYFKELYQSLGRLGNNLLEQVSQPD